MSVESLGRFEAKIYVRVVGHFDFLLWFFDQSSVEELAIEDAFGRRWRTLLSWNTKIDFTCKSVGFPTWYSLNVADSLGTSSAARRLIRIEVLRLYMCTTSRVKSHNPHSLMDCV